MKNLVLIRHSKSSWNKPSLADHERGLNERGKRDAPYMGEKLSHFVNPDKVIVSSSKRTVKTWEGMKANFNISNNKVVIEKKLYHANPSDIFELIRSCDKSVETLFLITHNPGITDFVNELCQECIENIPTTGVAIIKIKSFQSLNPGDGELQNFLYPKQFITD